MCPRELYSREKDSKLIDIHLIESMVRREEFAGSYFVELQLSGEPLLHPEIQNIIDLIKSTGVMVGFSTNGSLLNQEYAISHLNSLDYITISLDSVTNRAEIRKGFNKTFDEWYEESLKDAIYFLHMQGTTVDIQFIELPGYEEEINLFMEKAIDILPLVTIRTIPEAYFTFAHEGLYPWPDKGMCINPFLSVSIQSQGHVVPCCFCFGDDFIYGDIKEQSLEEIWNGPQVRSLRNAHRYTPLTSGYHTNIWSELPEICKRCYFRSPTFLHTNILYKSIRGKKDKWSV
jgi:radical SAM protein with 4Fe4S-binding SPASM domain